MPTHAKWLTIWFGRARVDQRTYLRHGVTLMAIKYAVEALVIGVAYGHVLDPVNFVFPSVRVREQVFGEDAPLAAAIWILWSIPFVWTAASMTVRRARDAGRSPLWVLLLFFPFLNVVLMLWYAALPTARSSSGAPPDPGLPLGSLDDPVWRFVVAAVLSLGVGFGSMALSIYVFQSYGAAMMCGVPFFMGFVAAFVRSAGRTRTLPSVWTSGAIPVFAFSAFLLLLGFEGLICIAMAVPIAMPFSVLGALVANTIIEMNRAPRRQAHVLVLILPAWLGYDVVPQREPELSVTTSVEVEAPIETVWQHVVSFSELPEPEEWFFRAGIAAPMRATIDGEGVGAVRRCEFTTGTFVEPITRWDPPVHLAFDVTEQPEPMTELSPYGHVHPPHLDGTLRSLRGEFRLERLGDGRTRLVGTTWYVLEMGPRTYWRLWSDALIQAIHRRVLEHIARLAEG